MLTSSIAVPPGQRSPLSARLAMRSFGSHLWIWPSHLSYYSPCHYHFVVSTGLSITKKATKTHGTKHPADAFLRAPLLNQELQLRVRIERASTLIFVSLHQEGREFLIPQNLRYVDIDCLIIRPAKTQQVCVGAARLPMVMAVSTNASLTLASQNLTIPLILGHVTVPSQHHWQLCSSPHRACRSPGCLSWYTLLSP